ncbi:unnamed protein product [Oikopleura dioica]|uniref:Uncharacterized protein n=1 Tax=Oikopleura dioica TaxID=34765 RepID=E4YAQ8_OIKDI|nr:unnamed protein product [Oikopleura dioica]
MTSRESLRHFKNLCGEDCVISDVFLQGNSATIFNKDGKKNIVTITPIDELNPGTLELFVAFYHLESLVLCGRLDDSTRCYRINSELDLKSLERNEALEPLIFPFSDFVIKSDAGKVLILEKDMYGFTMFLVKNDSILWKNSLSIGEKTFGTYESARNYASYIISSSENEGMITNYCQNDMGANKTPPEANRMCSTCVSYKLTCCDEESGICSSEILATTKHDEAIYAIFKLGNNSKLCRATLKAIDAEFLSKEQRYCYGTSCDSMSPSPKEMGKTIKISKRVCEDADIIFTDCDAPAVRLFSREYMTLVNSNLKTDKTLFMEEMADITGTPNSFIITKDAKDNLIIMLQENREITRGYLTENGLAMVDKKSFDENIILFEDVESFAGFSVEKQDIIDLDECHLPKLTSCATCADAIGCEWRNGECSTTTIPNSIESCPVIKISQVLESNNNYEGLVRKLNVKNSRDYYIEPELKSDLEIEDLPHNYAINIDKISANNIVQYYRDEKFEIVCSGSSVFGDPWSHSFDTQDLKTYVINKNEEKRTLEMQKNLKRIEEIFKAEKISNSQSYD